jgi:hypothetical protein
MLARPSRPTPVPVGDAVAVAYHCLLDGRVLADGLPGMPGIDDLGPDISTAALDELRRLSASLGAGLVPLGRAGDAKRFDKDRGMKAYALDDAFVGTFLLPEIEPETEAEP